MKKIWLILFFWSLLVLPVSAQEGSLITELDGSGLRQGSAFAFTVGIYAGEDFNVAEGSDSIRAVLCPAGEDTNCQTLSRSVTETETAGEYALRFYTAKLPAAGDYSLEVTYTDGETDEEAGHSFFLIKGVQPAPVPQGSYQVFLKETYTEIIKYPGEILFAGTPYLFTLNAPGGVTVSLPEMFRPENLSESSGCLKYLNEEGSAWQIPEDAFIDGGFSCSLVFNKELEMEAQTAVISGGGEWVTEEIHETQVTHLAGDADSRMEWNTFPTKVTRQSLPHQLQLADSAGNLLCTDTYPCQYMNSSDVFTLIYHFPPDYSGGIFDENADTGDLSVTLHWPEEWTDILRRSAEFFPEIDDFCVPEPDGTMVLPVQVTEGRLRGSCRFALADTPSSPAALALHTESAYYKTADLALQFPGNFRKAAVSLVPSLTMQMRTSDTPAEQISAGNLSRLYRTFRDSGIADYTLRGTVTGVPRGRAPQPGDSINVQWSLLDLLAQNGALPDCLTPNENGGYTLGTLETGEDGSWTASCGLRFPETIETSAAASALNMSLNSGLFETTAAVSCAYQPFTAETLSVGIRVPERFYLSNTAEMTAEIGELSEYQRALLESNPLFLSTDWAYNALSSCGGDFYFDENGKASCTARFDSPAEETTLAFTLNTADYGGLMEAALTPASANCSGSGNAVSCSLPAVTPVQARLIPELRHGETPMTFSASESFTIMEPYALRFRLEPEPGFETILDSLMTSDDGTVTEWGSPLSVNWAGFESGALALPFRRDGNIFTAEVPFQFTDYLTYPAFSLLNWSLSLPGWEIENAEGTADMPSSVELLQARLIPELRHGDTPMTFSASESFTIMEPYALRFRLEPEPGFETILDSLMTSDDGTVTEWGSPLSVNWAGFESGALALPFRRDGNAFTAEIPFHFAGNLTYPGFSLLNWSLSLPGWEIENAEGTADMPSSVKLMQARLTPELWHGDTPMTFSASESFTVLEPYTLRFTLEPLSVSGAYLNSLSSTEGETVSEWGSPLNISWAGLEGGSRSLSLRREGDTFTAEVPLTFTDVWNYPAFAPLNWSLSLPGWEIENGEGSVDMPSQLERKPVRLAFGDFYDPFTGEPFGDLAIGRSYRIDLQIVEGDAENMTLNDFMILAEQDGYPAPLSCTMDTAEKRIVCDYSAESGSDQPLTLTASYIGSALQEESEAEPKSVNIIRQELIFEIPEYGNLTEWDIHSIEAASEDLSAMGYGEIMAGGTRIDSYLIREIVNDSGSEYKKYPFTFTWSVDGGAQPRAEGFALDIVIGKANGFGIEEETVTLHPETASGNVLQFSLDFGSMLLTDNGELLSETLAKAVSIEKVVVRYEGDEKIAPAERRFEAKNVNFALKVVSLMEMSVTTGEGNSLRFNLPAAAESFITPYTVYCSQIWEPLRCSETPKVTYDMSLFIDENSDGYDDISGLEIPQSDAPFGENCWGTFTTFPGSDPVLYTDGITMPQCYLTATDNYGGIRLIRN